MITRIEVDGFKSLRGFSLEFEPLTAIIGANGAGKSNLFDVLRLLSLLPRMNVTEALRSLRGHIRDQFSQTKGGPGNRITISVEFLLDLAKANGNQQSTRWRYFICIERIARASGMTEELAITDEKLTSLCSTEDSWMANHSDFQPRARYDDEQNFVVRREVIDSRWHRVTASFGRENVHFERDESPLYSLLWSRDPAYAIEDIGEELSRIRFLHPDPGQLRLPSERGAGAMLLPDGSNLPTALASTTPEVRAQIRADLAQLVPGFRSFDIVPSDDELRLDIEFSDDTRVPARILSDGTLRLFAVLTLLRTQRSRGVIAIEEPENGIYPGRLRALVKSLEAAIADVPGQLPPQIILNSHSPALVAALHHRPELLVFADLVRLRDGLRSTRMRHVRSEKTQAHDHSTVSPDEIEQYLDTARPDEEA